MNNQSKQKLIDFNKITITNFNTSNTIVNIDVLKKLSGSRWVGAIFSISEATFLLVA